MTDALWSRPHHDGSTTYVPESNPNLGGKVTVFLRVPRTSDVTSAWVRVICDGEPELVRAAVDRHASLQWAGVRDVAAVRCLSAASFVPGEPYKMMDENRRSASIALRNDLLVPRVWSELALADVLIQRAMRSQRAAHSAPREPVRFLYVDRGRG